MSFFKFFRKKDSEKNLEKDEMKEFIKRAFKEEEFRRRHGEVPISVFTRVLLYKYNKNSNEIKNKLYLIDSELTKCPVECLAKNSLRDLEKALEEGKEKSELENMFKKHEELVQILRPYKGEIYIDGSPIYSDLYEEKYNILLKKVGYKTFKYLDKFDN